MRQKLKKICPILHPRQSPWKFPRNRHFLPCYYWKRNHRWWMLRLDLQNWQISKRPVSFWLLIVLFLTRVGWRQSINQALIDVLRYRLIAPWSRQGFSSSDGTIPDRSPTEDNFNCKSRWTRYRTCGGRKHGRGICKWLVLASCMRLLGWLIDWSTSLSFINPVIVWLIDWLLLLCLQY